jgi:hypothetical protein
MKRCVAPRSLRRFGFAPIPDVFPAAQARTKCAIRTSTNRDRAPASSFNAFNRFNTIDLATLLRPRTLFGSLANP